MKKLLLALLVLLALPAKADDLRVTILVPAGNLPLEYRLSEADGKDFWQRWARLPRSQQMVPLGGNATYQGLRIRSDSRDVRLYNGLGTYETETRRDDLRQLERWVLSKAPPPYGPTLLATLDQSIDVMAATQKTTTPSKQKDAAAIILQCNTRAARNQEVRARCLQDALQEKLDWQSYANLLEQALKASEKR